MSVYNYSNFSCKHFDLLDFKGPKVGEIAPDGKVLKTDGTHVGLLDFEAPFYVLETGSITCPLFQTRRRKMRDLVLEFPNVDFGFLYIREAPPGTEIAFHHSLQNKKDCATRLQKEDSEEREILIDDIAGTLHSAYGGFPNAIFIINANHCVVFRSEWNDPKAVKKALSRLLGGQPATNRSFFFPAYPPLAFSILRRGGKGSTWDFLKSLPTLIWMNFIVRNIKVLLNKPSSADINC